MAMAAFRQSVKREGAHMATTPPSMKAAAVTAVGFMIFFGGIVIADKVADSIDGKRPHWDAPATGAATPSRVATAATVPATGNTVDPEAWYPACGEGSATDAACVSTVDVVPRWVPRNGYSLAVTVTDTRTTNGKRFYRVRVA